MKEIGIIMGFVFGFFGLLMLGLCACAQPGKEMPEVDEQALAVSAEEAAKDLQHNRDMYCAYKLYCEGEGDGDPKYVVGHGCVCIPVTPGYLKYEGSVPVEHRIR